MWIDEGKYKLLMFEVDGTLTIGLIVEEDMGNWFGLSLNEHRIYTKLYYYRHYAFGIFMHENTETIPVDMAHVSQNLYTEREALDFLKSMVI